jgi:prevent-host-death family protein
MYAVKAADAVGVTSVKLKEKLGDYVSRAERGEVFRVLRHNRPRAVLMSWENFEHLLGAVPDPLETLRADFQSLADRMARNNAAAGNALFSASGAELGALAVAHATTGERQAVEPETPVTPTPAMR